jgi:hypothetical protein
MAIPEDTVRESRRELQRARCWRFCRLQPSPCPTHLHQRAMSTWWTNNATGKFIARGAWPTSPYLVRRKKLTSGRSSGLFHARVPPDEVGREQRKANCAVNARSVKQFPLPSFPLSPHNKKYLGCPALLVTDQRQIPTYSMSALKQRDQGDTR